LLTAALFVALAVKIAGEHQLGTLPAVLYFAAMGISLSVIDLDVGRLPNAIVYPSYPVLAILLTAAAFVDSNPAALLRAAVGAAVLFLLYFALAYLYPAGMGFGDVKLAGIIGGMLAFVSYPVLLVGAFAAFLFGSIFGAVKVANKRASGRSAIAFGPFMIAGALASLFVGSAVTDTYSTLFLGA
jgi:leader peptidase (prepilin peptidase)/N-methyltransferase